MKNTDTPSIQLSGRSLTSTQAFALISPAPAVRLPGSRTANGLRPTPPGEEVEGANPPKTGDLRLMATLDAASRKPHPDNINARSCSGVLQASFFDGAAWHRFDLPSLLDTRGFANAVELKAALGWARTAAADAAGHVCARRAIDKSTFQQYSLASPRTARA